MRTLYVQIIFITTIILLLSSLIAFIVTNVFYHVNLKPKNDEKITKLAQNIVNIYERNNRDDLDSYLDELTQLGYQFYTVAKDGHTAQFGKRFSTYELPDSEIETVLNGGVYHGIKKYPWNLMVTGFFDNDLINTIGVPVTDNGKQIALFVRPDTQQQFGEMRIFLSILLVLLVGLSFLFILLSTTYIVKPIKRLAQATRTIAEGNYHVEINVNRHDEIGTLAKDFSVMAKSLSKTEEKRQEFVSNVSHEIQSPLTSINGFSQALRESDLPENLRDEYLGIIEKESKRLSLLSKQLLTLSFLDSEDEQNDWLRCNVNSQLKEVVQTLTYQWEEKEIAVQLDMEDVWIWGDPKMLQQVWMNLITNAIHYTEQGGTIWIEARQAKHDVIISVKDTGIGIKTENIPYLFERFYKVDQARVRTDNSTGLGLAIVKRIIELHNGTIQVDSEEGVGTTFICTFKKA